MSNRSSAREAARAKKAVKALMRLPANRFCADCPAKGPTWASINIGCFVCMNCSGIHRGMGTHISKVRSTELDTWKPEWVANMKKWGNARVNAVWEAKLPRDYPAYPDRKSVV